MVLLVFMPMINKVMIQSQTLRHLYILKNMRLKETCYTKKIRTVKRLKA